MEAIALHGGWIPKNSGGRFFVWAEKKPKLGRKADDIHPFQLREDKLRSLVAALWPSTARFFETDTVWITLPGDGKGPAPSL